MRTHITLVASLLALVPTLSAPAHYCLPLSDQADVLVGGLQTKALAVDAYSPIHLSLIADTYSAFEVKIFDQHGRMVLNRVGAGAADVYLPGPTAEMLKNWAAKAEAEAQAQKAAALRSEAQRLAGGSADVHQPSADIFQSSGSVDPVTGGAADVYTPSADIFTPSNNTDPAFNLSRPFIDLSRPVLTLNRPEADGPCYRIEIRNLSFRAARLALIADVVN